MTHMTQENLAELDKFFVVAKQYFNETGQRANMPSCVVDSCWHELMEDDAQYVTFTQKAVGGRVEHLENKGFGLIEWVPVYERLFGKLANPWFVAPEGNAEAKAKAGYEQSGDLRMSWDCTPNMETPCDKAPARGEYDSTGKLIASWDCTPAIDVVRAEYDRSGQMIASWDCTPNVECPAGGKARSEYERSGKLIMSWDCTPNVGDDDTKSDASRPCPTRKAAAQHAVVH
jgi:hypothetical protein